MNFAAVWTEHLGPFVEEGAARKALLASTGVDLQPLVLVTGSGQRVTPGVLLEPLVAAGVEAVLPLLPAELVSRWNVASWLCSAEVQLEGRTPVQALRDGDLAQVVQCARSWAAQLEA